LENLLKPSINYVVTVAVDMDVVSTAPLVFTKIARVGDVVPGPMDDIIQVGGVVRRRGQDREPVAAARVTIKETGAEAVTDDEGHYSFANVRCGSYTLAVSTADGQAREITISVPGNYEVEV
ncbi:MAG: carboxypeptidase regulatory-like domain-containing protein, partial [Chloroflexota bacterium]